ncbi:MAG: polysaccharide lyase family 8 super-sandwich domain-containing protein [Paludibacteraceae bacterium]
MRTKMLYVFCLCVWMTTAIARADIPFALKNTTAIDRNVELVEVSIPASMVSGLSSMGLYDDNNKSIPYQSVSGNKIIFQATISANSTSVYTLKTGTPATATTKTYVAQKMPANRNDIAWENDLVAHRMYSKVLLSSEPNTANGVDLWVKKQATPVIDKMYTYSNYHAEQTEGVDAYSVNGKTLGAGGVVAYVNNKLWLHDPYDECIIISNGPLRSEFVLTYKNVLIDGDYYTKTLRILTNANGLLDKAIVKFEGKIKPMKIAAGIFLHTNMTGVTPEGIQYTSEENVIGYAENKSEGTLTSSNSRFYEGIYMPGETSTAVIDNHLVIMSDYAVGSEFTYYFGGGWNIFPAGRYTQDQDWFSALKNFKSTIQNPLFVNPEELPSKSEVVNEGIRVNSLWQADHTASFLDNAWYSGVYQAGNMAFYNTYPQKAYLNYAKEWAESKTWGVGTHSSADADNVAVGQTYIDLYNLDAQKIASKIAAIKSKIDNFSQQWWWIDAMYMAMPAYARLGTATGDNQYYEKMYMLFKNTRDTLLVSSNTGLWSSELSSQYGSAPYATGWTNRATDGLFNKEKGLWYRDWGYQPGVPLKRDPNNGGTSDSDTSSDYCAKQTLNGKDIFWGRGNGWAIGAMAHTLRCLPNNAPHREEYELILKTMAPALKACQREDGAWNMSLYDSDYRPGGETSGTALITFALAWGINNHLLDSATYYSVIAKAWNNLVKYSVQTNGVVSRIQGEGEAPIDPTRLMNSRNTSESKKVAFGVGVFLCAASEVAKLAPGIMPEAPQVLMSLDSVVLQDATHIKATFSHTLESTSAQNIVNYIIADAPAIVSVAQLNTKSVVITLSGEIDYGRYKLTVSDVKGADELALGADNSKIFLHTVPLTAVDYAQTVTAIGNQTGNPPANTVDNNLATRWAQAGTGQWIQFDLGNPFNVYAIDIAYYLGTSRLSYFNVQTSTDGTNFTTVLSNQTTSGLTDEMERYKFSQPVSARYVRIVGNGNSTGGENWNSITEVRVRFDNTPVFDVIMKRIRETEWAGVSSNVTALDADVSALLTNLATNGSWADIDYTSTAQTSWEPVTHLDRLKKMVQAYTLNTSSYYGKAEVFSAISTALEFWYTADPRSTNWYMQQIACPQRMGVMLILMRAGAQHLSSELETKLLTRMETIGGRPDQSGSQGTGANKVDIATHWVYRGCLKEDASVLSFGVEQVYYPVFITTSEGLQSDFSYFQHGQQFFTGGYGYSFVNGIARIANFTIGTQYQMPAEKLQLLTTFTRDAYLRLIRGQYFMYNVIGRGLSRPDALDASGSIEVAKRVQSLDTENSAEYTSVIKRMNGAESPSFGMSIGQKHYWRGDYSLYYSPDYNFDVRMASTRTYRNENGNGENIKGYFLSEGAHTITVDGDEYLDIFPVWNWTRIPGITAPQKSSIPQPAQWGTYGTSAFAGGVSNGKAGITVFSLNNSEYSINTSAQKTWFMFGNEVVCLGAGIKSTASEEINSTINQCLHKGDIVMSANGTTTTLTTGTFTPTNIDWIYHNKVGYYFPKGGNINLSNAVGSGNWSTINTAYSGVVSKDIFTLWFNHGTMPTAADYAYIVVPGKTLEEVKQYNVNDIEILVNSDSLQVVRHKSQNLWGFVFYKAASFTNADFNLKAGNSCALMLKNPETTSVSGWLSDPSQLKRELSLRFVSAAIPSEKELVTPLPETPYAGSTVNIIIDANSPDYDPTVAQTLKIYPRTMLMCVTEVMPLQTMVQMLWL